jgi:hypothetical protein
MLLTGQYISYNMSAKGRTMYASDVSEFLDIK